MATMSLLWVVMVLTNPILRVSDTVSLVNSGKSHPEPDGRSARWDTHRVQRREELLAQVITAVREHGSAVNMDQIAASAGTSKAMFYKYFSDKAELYRVVGRKLAGDLVAEVAAAVGAESDDRTMLRAGVDAYLRLLDTEPQLYRFVVHNPAVGTVDYSSVISELISSIFDSRLSERGLPGDPAGPWGIAVVGAVRAAGDWWLENPGLSRQELSDYLTALLWDGMNAAHTASSTWKGICDDHGGRDRPAGRAGRPLGRDPGERSQAGLA
jgi:AcrR family transcriptional regulator